MPVSSLKTSSVKGENAVVLVLERPAESVSQALFPLLDVYVCPYARVLELTYS